MARVKIDLPEIFNFSTNIEIRIGDVNYGGHVGNDAILGIMHTARLKYLASFGYSELDLEGVSMIMADSAVQYKGESFFGDTLTVFIQAVEFHKLGFDLIYKIENQDHKSIAFAKTGMLCFDYKERKLASMPENAKINMQ